MLRLSRKDYISRLRNSSFPELIYRAKQTLVVLRLKRILRQKANPIQAPIIDPSDVKSLELPSFQAEVDKDIVKGILQGEIFSLNENRKIIRSFEEKFRQFFFADIKLSEASFDIRQVWEPARLQHTTLLIAYILQNTSIPDSKIILQFSKRAVLKWVDDNSFLFGPHYMSAMECGLRIPAFLYCLRTLDELSAIEFESILNLIYQHAWWVSRRLSLYSSLGNHTICECVGLIFAGAIFRNTKEGSEWLKTGRNLLKQELDHQILDDGGPAEQSFNYHRFVLDLYWLVIDFLEKNYFHNCSDFKERLKQGERFLSAFKDSFGRLPSIGDSDDGHAIAPGLNPRRIVPHKKYEKLQTFSTSGYTIINCNNAVLIFDHGPLGMTPLYNHGHADALSITLSIDDKEILVDPGTYRYNGEPEFRKYFKGTRAHNTVTIDGLDQAVQETGFIWSRPYTAKLVKSVEINDHLFLQANHDGYIRIKDPVRHFRSIVNFDETNFVIKDTFLGKGIHTFELNYHVHPDSEITSEDNAWWKIDNNGAVIYIRLLGKNNFTFIKGRTDPIFGWYSPAYGIKRESGVLSCTMRGTSEEVSFVTAICIQYPQK